MRATAVFNASETSEQGQGTFSRSHDREAPHNVIVNTQKLAANHADIAAPQAMWDFAASAAESTASTAATAAGAKSGGGNAFSK